MLVSGVASRLSIAAATDAAVVVIVVIVVVVVVMAVLAVLVVALVGVGVVAIAYASDCIAIIAVFRDAGGGTG